GRGGENERRRAWVSLQGPGPGLASISPEGKRSVKANPGPAPVRRLSFVTPTERRRHQRGPVSARSSPHRHSFTRMFLISIAPNSARRLSGVAVAPGLDLRTVLPLIRCSTLSPVTMTSRVYHSPSLTSLFSLLPGIMSNLVPRRKTSLLHFGPGLKS